MRKDAESAAFDSFDKSPRLERNTSALDLAVPTDSFDKPALTEFDKSYRGEGQPLSPPDPSVAWSRVQRGASVIKPPRPSDSGGATSPPNKPTGSNAPDGRTSGSMQMWLSTPTSKERGTGIELKDLSYAPDPNGGPGAKCDDLHVETREPMDSLTVDLAPPTMGDVSEEAPKLGERPLLSPRHKPPTPVAQTPDTSGTPNGNRPSVMLATPQPVLEM